MWKENGGWVWVASSYLMATQLSASPLRKREKRWKTWPLECHYYCHCEASILCVFLISCPLSLSCCHKILKNHIAALHLMCSSSLFTVESTLTYGTISILVFPSRLVSSQFFSLSLSLSRAALAISGRTLLLLHFTFTLFSFLFSFSIERLYELYWCTVNCIGGWLFHELDIYIYRSIES